MKRLSIQEIFDWFGAITGGTAKKSNTKIRSKVLYVSGLGTKLSNNNGKMILPSDTKEYGVTNFDTGNRLAAGRKLEVIGIRLLFDTTTGAGVSTKTATWKDEIPTSFKNGEITINQQGSGDLITLPMNVLSKYSGQITTTEDFYPVVPFLLRDQTDTEITAVQVGAAAGATTAWRLELQTLEYTESEIA